MKTIAIFFLSFFFSMSMSSNPIPLSDILNICKSPTCSNVTMVLEKYGWKRNYNIDPTTEDVMGPAWYSATDDLMIHVKSDGNGKLIKMVYAFKKNSSVTLSFTNQMEKYGFEMVDHYTKYNTDYFVYRSNLYRAELGIWERDGIEYSNVTFTLAQ